MATRVFNIIASLLAMTLLSVPFCIVWIMVKITSSGPAIHWSKRIGKGNEIFLMPKFRTMHVGTPQLATHLMNNTRSHLTSIGSFLRKSSLDELPQLWSVLKGDMSLVGPRPALFNQYDLRDLRTHYNIHTLAPGVTGWAQINGRDELSIEEKVKLDKQYLDQKDLTFDIKIIMMTILKVLSRKDISH